MNKWYKVTPTLSLMLLSSACVSAQPVEHWEKDNAAGQNIRVTEGYSMPARISGAYSPASLSRTRELRHRMTIEEVYEDLSCDFAHAMPEIFQIERKDENLRLIFREGNFCADSYLAQLSGNDLNMLTFMLSPYTEFAVTVNVNQDQEQLGLQIARDLRSMGFDRDQVQVSICHSAMLSRYDGQACFEIVLSPAESHYHIRPLFSNR